MMKSPRSLTRDLVKELVKHAQRDECYVCRVLLTAMSLDWRKTDIDTMDSAQFKQILLEQLAALEHEQWCNWVKWMTSQNMSVPDSWRKLAGTPYSELTEAQKESDRKYARIVMDAIFGGT